MPKIASGTLWALWEPLGAFGSLWEPLGAFLGSPPRWPKKWSDLNKIVVQERPFFEACQNAKNSLWELLGASGRADQNQQAREVGTQTLVKYVIHAVLLYSAAHKPS